MRETAKKTLSRSPFTSLSLREFWYDLSPIRLALVVCSTGFRIYDLSLANKCVLSFLSLTEKQYKQYRVIMMLTQLETAAHARLALATLVTHSPRLLAAFSSPFFMRGRQHPCVVTIISSFRFVRPTLFALQSEFQPGKQ